MNEWNESNCNMELPIVSPANQRSESETVKAVKLPIC